MDRHSWVFRKEETWSEWGFRSVIMASLENGLERILIVGNLVRKLVQ